MCQPNEIDLRGKALNIARSLGSSSVKEYPYPDELRTNREDFFMFNSDFAAYLNNALFWEFKRLGLWQNITNKDWDDVVKLGLETAYDTFIKLNQDSKSP